MDDEQQIFEESLKNIPNDLGATDTAAMIAADELGLDPTCIPRFSNDDLSEDSTLTREEAEAMYRLMPPAAELQDSSDLKEIALTKMFKLAGIFRAQYDMREFIENDLAGYTSDDLVMSMMSVAGEMGRLRTLVPKLMLLDDEEEEEAA